MSVSPTSTPISIPNTTDIANATASSISVTPTAARTRGSPSTFGQTSASTWLGAAVSEEVAKNCA